MFIKVIKKKGVVKTYFTSGKPSDKFFCVFEGSPELKAMLPAALFPLVQVGTSLEIEGELGLGDWINKIEVKSIGGTTTTMVPTSTVNSSSTTTSTTTTQSIEERVQVEVEYITKPKVSKNGNEYVMAKFLKGQPVENVYIPTKAIPAIRHDEILGGFGTLDVTGNRNSKGDTLFVSAIHEFKPTTKELSSEIEIKNCSFRLHYISFIDSNGNVVTIPQEEVPFGFSPVFEKVKSEFKGSIKVIGSFRKTGNWKKNKTTKKWELQTNWEDHGKITYDFSLVDVDSIKRIEEKHLQDIEYARILATLKQTKGFTSFSSIKGMFTSKGLSISTQEIENLYWDEKYDREYYNVLKHKADEIFVSEEEFVFIIRLEGKEFRVVERPVQNSATYLFNDVCEISQLLDRLRITKKFDIIRDSEAQNGIKLQTILGYVGRVVHQDYEGWLSKIQTHIGEGVERMLEDKFVF